MTLRISRFAGVGVVVPSRGVVVESSVVWRSAVRRCDVGAREGLVVASDVYDSGLCGPGRNKKEEGEGESGNEFFHNSAN